MPSRQSESSRDTKLRPGPQVIDSDAVHRARLVDAVVRAVADKGYAAATIGDIVRLARVSRRTFYELFADKEACFLAAFDARADVLLATLDNAVARQTQWEDQLRAGFDAYLLALAAEPESTRVFLVEVPSSAPRVRARRRRVYERWAAELRSLVQVARRENPHIRAITRDLSPLMAQAVVGAVHELVLIAVEEDRMDEIPALRDTAADLLRSVVSVPQDVPPPGVAPDTAG